MNSGVLNSITQSTFAYDADELRIANSNALTGHVTHYVYDADGQIVAEMDGATGNPIREYIWLGGLPVGYVDRLGAGGASRLFFIHADHIARPQKITDASRAVVWDGVFAPFGEVHAVTGSIVNVLMFPGQVYDPETGLSQNWHRDYDANIGRYMQSDPIGLEGGFNTYAYANANPVTITDPTGEVGLGGAALGVAFGILTDEDGCYTWQELVRDAVLGAAGDIGIRAVAIGIRELQFASRLGKFLGAGRGAPRLGLGGGAGFRSGGGLGGHGGPGGFGGFGGFGNSADEVTTVIGRTRDLKNLAPGERSLLDRLKGDLGSPSANWKRNSGVLREEMRRGRPIRDASPNDNDSIFLNAERALLKERGWTFDRSTNFWMPPGL